MNSFDCVENGLCCELAQLGADQLYLCTPKCQAASFKTDEACDSNTAHGNTGVLSHNSTTTSAALTPTVTGASRMLFSTSSLGQSDVLPVDALFTEQEVTSDDGAHSDFRGDARIPPPPEMPHCSTFSPTTTAATAATPHPILSATAWHRIPQNKGSVLSPVNAADGAIGAATHPTDGLATPPMSPWPSSNPQRRRFISPSDYRRSTASPVASNVSPVHQECSGFQRHRGGTTGGMPLSNFSVVMNTPPSRRHPTADGERGEEGCKALAYTAAMEAVLSGWITSDDINGPGGASGTPLSDISAADTAATPTAAARGTPQTPSKETAGSGEAHHRCLPLVLRISPVNVETAHEGSSSASTADRTMDQSPERQMILPATSPHAWRALGATRAATTTTARGIISLQSRSGLANSASLSTLPTPITVTSPRIYSANHSLSSFTCNRLVSRSEDFGSRDFLFDPVRLPAHAPCPARINTDRNEASFTGSLAGHARNGNDGVEGSPHPHLPSLPSGSFFCSVPSPTTVPCGHGQGTPLSARLSHDERASTPADSSCDEHQSERHRCCFDILAYLQLRRNSCDGNGHRLVLGLPTIAERGSNTKRDGEYDSPLSRLRHRSGSASKVASSTSACAHTVAAVADALRKIKSPSGGTTPSTGASLSPPPSPPPWLFAQCRMLTIPRSPQKGRQGASKTAQKPASSPTRQQRRRAILHGLARLLLLLPARMLYLAARSMLRQAKVAIAGPATPLPGADPVAVL